MSRTSNSLKNVRYATLLKLLVVVVNFLARRVFITVLTDEYLGLNGTFANILSVLSLAELGVGTAITFSMYQPLAEHDDERLLSLTLTEKGRALKADALNIPPAIAECMGLTAEEFGALYTLTYKALRNMEERNTEGGRNNDGL